MNFFFFKQKTAYELRISDWSSDVCSSDLSIWPRVMQKPHPVVYGSGNSEESIRFAATRRLGIAFSFAPPEAAQKWIEMYRSEERRVGKECVSTCRSRWLPYH